MGTGMVVFSFLFVVLVFLVVMTELRIAKKTARHNRHLAKSGQDIADLAKKRYAERFGKSSDELESAFPSGKDGT